MATRQVPKLRRRLRALQRQLRRELHGLQGLRCALRAGAGAVAVDERRSAMNKPKPRPEKRCEYPDDMNPWNLEPHYSRHVAAMTSEGLHSKAEIAMQLAWRDQTIARLEASALAAAPDGCPCLLTKPCHPRCTCVDRFQSRGCDRCAKYGSLEQRRAAAETIAADLAAAPLAPTGGGEMEHLEEGARLFFVEQMSEHGADHAQIIAWLKAEVPRRRARGEPQIAAVEAQQSASKEGERAEGYLAALTELESRVCDDRGCNCWQMVLKNMRAEHDGSEAF